MIIQCPACSTGFNLPDKHITAKGAKLRCSRCSHVFRVRRPAPEQDIEIFYKPEDERSNAKNAMLEGLEESDSEVFEDRGHGDHGGFGDEVSQAIELGADFDALLRQTGEADAVVAPRPEPRPESAPAKKAPLRTEIGLPSVSTTSSSSPDLSGYGFGSSSRAASEDPFPLAGGDLKALKQNLKEKVGNSSRPSLNLKSVSRQPEVHEAPAAPAPTPASTPEPTPAASLSDLGAPAAPAEEGLDLFGDALGMAPQNPGADPFGDAFDDELSPESFAQDHDAPFGPKKGDDILLPGTPALRPAGSNHAAPSTLDAAAATAALSQASAHDGLFQSSAARGQSAAPIHNSAFVDAGDLVDPSFGTEVPSFDPQQGVVNTPAVQPQRAAQPQAAAARAHAPASPSAHATTSGSTAARVAAPAAANYDADSWPSQADALAAHRIGGSGAQKAANVLLLVSLVTLLFFGLLAALNDGMLDFKQFGAMIENGFGGGTYTPRPEWIPKEKPQPKVAVEAPLRTESVWAEVVPYGKRNKVLVVRGLLRNFDQQDYLDVTLRGIVLNGKEKIIGEQIVPLGENVPNARIKTLSAVDDPKSLLPQASSPLKVASSEPFTIFFPDIPQDVLEGEPVFFRVDVKQSTGREKLDK